MNSTNLACLEQSFQRSLAGGGNGLPIRKGRPSTSTYNSEYQYAKKTQLKRITTLYDSAKCIFCQYEEDSDLHEVQTANMGKRVMEVLQKSEKECYNVIAKCFSDPLDVQAYDTKYHRTCLIKEERLSLRQSITKDRTLSLCRAIANIEIVNIVKHSRSQNLVLSLNDLNEEYINILKENGMQETSSNYKKLIQEFIKDNIPNAEIRGSYRKNECNIVTSKETVNSVLATHLDDDDNEGDM